MPRQEQMPSPEEQAEIEKERAITEAELLKGGAKYKINEGGEKILIPTEKQRGEIKGEMNTELRGRIEKEFEKRRKELDKRVEEVAGMCGFTKEEMQYYLQLRFPAARGPQLERMIPDDFRDSFSGLSGGAVGHYTNMLQHKFSEKIERAEFNKIAGKDEASKKEKEEGRDYAERFDRLESKVRTGSIAPAEFREFDALEKVEKKAKEAAREEQAKIYSLCQMLALKRDEIEIERSVSHGGDKGIKKTFEGIAEI